jgi:hypothetical protein
MQVFHNLIATLHFVNGGFLSSTNQASDATRLGHPVNNGPKKEAHRASLNCHLGSHAFKTISTSSSIFLASPNSMRLFSL